MKEFFGKDVLLEGETAKALYEEVKDLPIIDYHCHLDQEKIASDGKFENIGQLWLAGDHYKWRAMRMCGVDEHYITGDASWEEKFLKYAEILPNLIGGPLYYWTHLELQQVFGIKKPLNKNTAAEIYKEANEKIKKLSVRKLLKMFRVEYVATTNDPLENLESHGKYDDTIVAPTFRPDKLYNLDSAYIAELGKAAGIKIVTLNDLKKAISVRLDHFVSKGCRISDHGFLDFPKAVASEEFAEFLFESRETLSADERVAMFGYVLLYLM
jgi:glucuronate isomerase